MSLARVWILGLLAFLAVVMFAEGSLRHQNIPFMRPDRRQPCKPEWRKHKSHCYRIRRAPRLPHHDAQRACQMESSQARLATLTDETRNFLSTQIQQDDADSLWVAGKNCASLGRDEAVNDTKGCGELKGYICAELDRFVGCPEGQVGFGNFCFSEATIRRAWRTARLFCRLQGARGDLASIHSEEQYDFLRREFGNGPNDQLWIGLHKESPDTPYRWANGDKVQYLPWAPDYMGQETQGYVTMSLRDRQFTTQPLSDLAIPFLCSTVRIVDATTDIRETIQDAQEAIRQELDEVQEAVRDAKTAAKNAAKESIEGPIDIARDVIDASQDITDEVIDATGDVWELFLPCDRFWFPFGQNCYRAFFEKTSFNGAQESCRERGGNLTSLHNPFQSEFVRTQVIGKRPKKAYWIGLSNGRQGLQWTDGSPLDYMNWNAKKSNVLQLSTFKGCFQISGLKVRWTPADCQLKLFYVCQKRADDATTLAAASKTSAKATGTKAERKTVTTPEGKATKEEATEYFNDTPPLTIERDFPKAENTESETVELPHEGTQSELKLSAEDRAAWDKALAKMEGETQTLGEKSSKNTGLIFGVLGSALAVAVVAFGVISWRRSSHNQQYSYKPVRRSKSRSGRRSSQGMTLDDVVQGEGEMEAAKVVDPQKVIYGTIG